MRKAAWSFAVLALAACQPAVPNSAAGVGFGDYASYMKNREAELRGQTAAPASAAPPPGGGYAAQPPGGGYGTAGYGATPVTAAGIAAQNPPAGGSALEAAASAAPQGSLGAEALAALRATAPAGSTAPAAQQSIAAQAGAPLNAPLNAMSEAAFDPAAVAGSAGPNLAAYALSAPNTLGQPYYKRGGIKLSSSERACGKFVSPDLAQMKFLERGGPEKDPGNLDPDGDGFACAWDPRPFQAARP